MSKRIINLGRRIAGLLRHHPEKKGLTVSHHGWTSTKQLCEALEMTMEELDKVVETNNKKRFEYSKDKKLIRAVQGHSIDVNVGLQKKTPPDILYHGTSEDVKINITNEGLSNMDRLHVHLSEEPSTALNVGKRHGEPIVLEIDTNAMVEEGYEFYQSKNDVWLSEFVPTKFITIML